LGLGLCNGLITQFMGVPAFIATLGTGYVLYGVAQIVSQGSNINRLPKDFLAIGRTPILGLPSAVFLALGVAVVFRVLISRTIFGRQLEALGLGARAAALSGVPDIIDDELFNSLVSQSLRAAARHRKGRQSVRRHRSTGASAAAWRHVCPSHRLETGPS
jgi:predicted ABC-type sugar transport system permease subunit